MILREVVEYEVGIGDKMIHEAANGQNTLSFTSDRRPLQFWHQQNHQPCLKAWQQILLLKLQQWQCSVRKDSCEKHLVIVDVERRCISWCCYQNKSSRKTNSLSPRLIYRFDIIKMSICVPVATSFSGWRPWCDSLNHISHILSVWSTSTWIYDFRKICEASTISNVKVVSTKWS